MFRGLLVVFALLLLSPLPAAYASVVSHPALVVPAAPANLLNDAGFESGAFSSWENEGGMAIVTADAWRGSYGLHVQPLGHPRVNQVFGTTLGTTYYVAAHVRINQEQATPAWGGLRVQVVDSTFAALGSFGNIAASSSPVDTWTRVDFSFVATTAQSRIQFENFSGGGLFDASADDFIVSETPIPADDAPTATPTATAGPAAPTATARPTAPTATAGPPTPTIPAPVFDAAPVADAMSDVGAKATEISTQPLGMLIFAPALLFMCLEVLWLFVEKRRS